MTEEQSISNHLSRMSDQMVRRDLQRYAPDVLPYLANLWRLKPGEWHFEYLGWVWEGTAADSGEARRKAWTAYLHKIQAPGY